MSNSKSILLFNKIKNKTLIFECIQGFSSHRHFILPYLIENDKILQKKLTILNNILMNNKLSSDLIIIYIHFYQIECFIELLIKKI